MYIFKKQAEDLQYFEAGDHTILTEVYHPKNDNNSKLPYSLAFAKIEPEKQSLLHTLEQDEMYIFTKGSGIIEIGKQSFNVKQGTCILVPKDIPQTVINKGTTILEFYCIVSPPWTEKGEVIL